MDVSHVKRATGQHHGDLRNSLLEVARELVTEAGPLGWTMAEASRRAGVSVAAPYKHFRDRDDLLAALAVQGFESFAATLRQAVVVEDARAALAAFAAAYVRFAWDERPLFEAAFFSGRDKSAYPELLAAGQTVFDLLVPAATQVVGASDADRLVLAVGAVAHGFACLLVGDSLGSDDAVLTRTEDNARRAVDALVRGSASPTKRRR